MTTSGRTPCAALLLGLILGFSAQAFGQSMDFCWSDTSARGVGTIPIACGPDQEKNGALCYPRCQPGFVSDGVAGCIQTCPAGATNDGLFCGWPSYKAAEYPAWDEGRCRANHPTGCWQTVPVIGVWVEHCRAGYRHVAGFCERTEINCAAMGFAGNRIANSCAKRHYFRAAALPSCGSGQEYDAGLCYPVCANGGDGVGPLCWGKGPAGWVKCGAAWAKDTATCNRSTAPQLMSIVDTAVATTTVNASSGRAPAEVISRSAWDTLKALGTDGVKQHLVSTANAFAQQQGGATACTTVSANADRIVQMLWKFGQLEHESSAVAVAVKSQLMAQLSLESVATIDPTGLTKIVANFTKPRCSLLGAVTTRSVDAPAMFAPTGGIAEMMKTPAPVMASFAMQETETKAELDAATARAAALKASYDAASGATKTLLQSQLTEAEAVKAAVQATQKKELEAKLKFQEASTKWNEAGAVGCMPLAAPAPAPAPTAAPKPDPEKTPTLSWGEVNYKAYDIAVGANGAVWFISAATPDGSNGWIYRVTAQGPEQVPGGAMRIAVDPAGIPWVVNAGNQIFRWNGSGWQLMPGAARDIGIGANGAVWVIGTDQSPYRWTGTTWSRISGGAVLISVDPSGNPWVVNAGNQIWRYDGTNWHLLPGAAIDIGVGADGNVYVVGTGQTTGGSQVYRWVPSANNWTAEAGAVGFSVAGGPAGTVYVARSRASGMNVLARIPR